MENKFKFKRKRRSSPNLLFLEWLRELRNEAYEKHWNSYTTFKKATNSMEKFPLILNCGKECSILDGVGPRICNIIDQKLVALSKEMGCSISETLQRKNAELRENQMKKFNVDSIKKCLKPKRKSQDSNDCDMTPSASKKIRKSQSPKEYSPKVGTGPHALLITLYENSLAIGVRDACMGKEELIRLAQPRCHSSFSHPDVVGSYYTAWASMGSLVKRGLVNMDRNPSRYCLTSYGFSLAERLDTGDNGNTSNNKMDKYKLPTKPKKRKRKHEDILVSDSDMDDEKDDDGGGDGDIKELAEVVEHQDVIEESSPTCSKNERSSEVWTNLNLNSFLARCITEDDMKELNKPSTSFTQHVNSDEDEDDDILPLSERLVISSGKQESNKSTSGSFFRFWYRNAAGSDVRYRDNAVLKEGTVDGEAGYLIQCNLDELVTSGFRYSLNLDSLGILNDGQVLAFIHKGDAPKRCEFPEPCSETSNLKTLDKSSEDQMPSKAIDEFVKQKPKSNDTRDMLKNELTGATKDIRNLKVTTKVIEDHTVVKSKLDNNKEPKVSQGMSTELSNDDRNGYLSKEPSISRGNTDLDVEDIITLDHFSTGQTTVRLIVDTREHFGMGRVKQQLLPALLRNNISCDVRALPVGDFAWLVQGTSDLAEGTEGVIDFIVERKRVDDLASSIKDGRFGEQKARMKRCGFSRIVYLVEEFGGMKHTSLPPAVLMQALTNANMIDECIVMFCRHIEDTVSYLSTVTQQLQLEYSQCSVDVINRWPKEFDTNFSSTSRLCLEWKLFVHCAAKSPDPTVRELFAKQLLRLHGTGPERVEAILQICPTPKSMIEKCSSVESMEWANLFGKLKFGASQRSVGVALSRAICQYYSAT